VLPLQVVNYYFNHLSETRSRYPIKPENLWNFDEKGFLLGVSSKEQVLCRSNRKNPRVRQEGSRELITLIQSISAAGMMIPPFIIYKGGAQYMGWHDYEENGEAVFALSSTGWSNDYLGLRWLKEHFYTNTCPADSLE